MLTRHTARICAVLAALVLPLGLATAAHAQEVPDTCAEATAAVAELQADVDALRAQVVTLTGDINSEQGELDALPPADATEAELLVVANAEAAFEAELPELLEFAEEDYPDDTRPTLDDVRDIDYLRGLLPEDPDTDSNLGGGAQNEVLQAIAAYEAWQTAQGDLDAVVLARAQAINDQEELVGGLRRDLLAVQAELGPLEDALSAAIALRAQLCPAPTPTPTDTGTPTPTPTDTVTPSPTASTAAPVPSSTVVPAQPASRSGTLPRTGSADAGFLVPLALLLLVGGATVVGATKLYKGRNSTGTAS